MALRKPQPAPDVPSDAQPDARLLPRDIAGLLQQLHDADPSVRRWAVRDLAHEPEARWALCQALEAESDHTVRTAICTALEQLGGDIVVTRLIALLRSDDTHLRNAAIEVLKQLPEDMAPQMQAILHDPDSDVRIFAVDVLESLRHPDVETWLLDVVAHDPHVNVVASALNVLAEVGTEATLAVIDAVPARFSDDPYVCFAVAAVKKRIAVN